MRGGALRVQPAARQGRRGHERERGRRGRDERAGDEVGVREARHLADAEAGGEPEREGVEALERERHRGAVHEPPEAGTHAQRDGAPAA